MGQLFRDLRFGGRSLARSPGFAAVALATIALGIGANTAIFSVVDAVLLRPLPFPGADRLVAVSQNQPSLGVTGNGVSYPELRRLAHPVEILRGARGDPDARLHADRPRRPAPRHRRDGHVESLPDARGHADPRTDARGGRRRSRRSVGGGARRTALARALRGRPGDRRQVDSSRPEARRRRGRHAGAIQDAARVAAGRALADADARPGVHRPARAARRPLPADRRPPEERDDTGQRAGRARVRAGGARARVSEGE